MTLLDPFQIFLLYLILREKQNKTTKKIKTSPNTYIFPTLKVGTFFFSFQVSGKITEEKALARLPAILAYLNLLFEFNYLILD